jgi:hypothetical protein
MLLRLDIMPSRDSELN